MLHFKNRYHHVHNHSTDLNLSRLASSSSSSSSSWRKYRTKKKQCFSIPLILWMIVMVVIIVMVCYYNFIRLFSRNYLLPVLNHEKYKNNENQDDTLRTKITKQERIISSSSLTNIPPLNSNEKDGKNHDMIVSSPIKIAHVISLIQCHKKNRVVGMFDALLILRYSIHKHSIHCNESSSKYSYQMIAFIHQDDKQCIQYESLLQRYGYITKIVSTPVNISNIQNTTYGRYYKTHVENENCCGSKEFIKLYAYTLEEYPIVVHWDIDVLLLKPLDHLYDIMLLSSTQQQKQQNLLDDNITTTKLRSHIQRPLSQVIPTDHHNTIDAFFTRDVTSSYPWEHVQGVQGGFLILKPNITQFQLYQSIILNGYYIPGRGNASGWGGLGYGGFQGAMAYQGLVGYFYDIIYPNHSIELNVCTYNQVAADVIHRGPLGPTIYNNTCRQYAAGGISIEKNTIQNKQCEDCRIKSIDDIYSVHYTACKKPWECILPYPRIPKDRSHTYRLMELTNITTCGLLFHKYYQYRYELESLIIQAITTTTSTNTSTNITITDDWLRRRGVDNNNKVSYHPEFYLGYCRSRGNYISMNHSLLSNPNFRFQQVYGV